MSDLKDQLTGYHSFICCLGTRRKYGEELFIKVDKQYPINFAVVCKDIEIPYFSLLTSGGADSTSSFLYMRTKGEVEEAIRALGLKHLVIFRPGLLTDRNNDFRVGEKLLGYVPCVPKCDAKELGKGMLAHSIEFHNGEETDAILENRPILRYIEQIQK